MKLWKANDIGVDYPSAGPITIAFVIFGLGCGGAEIALLELIKGLDRARFKPIIISLAPRAALSDAFQAAGVEIHYLGLKRIEQAPLVLFRAWRLVRRLRPALLHGVMFYGDLVARLLRMFGETPRVVTAVHNTNIGSRSYEHVMHWSDRFTDAVTAVSDEVARCQVRAGSIHPGKVTVIRNGIDLERVAPPAACELEAQRVRLGLRSSDRVLLCVARLEPAKEHALLLRVFQRLSARVVDVKLLLVGGGRLEGDLRALASRLHIADKVLFAGQVTPVAPMFHLADVFALSSSHEGLPLVVLEAMAAQLPMVLTSVGGIPEVVDHERTGILVPPGDEHAFATALEQVFAMSDEARATMGRAARRRVEERYRVEHMVAATQSLYDQILETQPRQARAGVPSALPRSAEQRAT
jgi:glycosyltransferase involved in cell wall biosynthesis